MRTCPFCGSGEDIDETRCSLCERKMPPLPFSQRTEIPLAPEDQRAVADAILDPPEPGEKLKEAVADYLATFEAGDLNRAEEATSALVWKRSPDCFVLDVSEGQLRDRTFGLSHDHSPLYFGMDLPVSDGLWRWNGVVTWDRNRPEPLDVNGRYEPPLWTGTVSGACDDATWASAEDDGSVTTDASGTGSQDP